MTSWSSLFDADLYSSTIYVLRRLRDYIVPGTYLYFDNMSQPPARAAGH